MAEQNAPIDTQNSAPAVTPTNDAPTPVADGGASADSGIGSTAEADASLIGGAKSHAGSGDADKAKGAEGGDSEGDEAETGPPDTYALKVSTVDDDGKPVDVELDAALMEKASPLFKEVGLTNAQANKLAPLALEVQNRMRQQISDDHTQRIADWAKAVKSDPELGGAKWPQTETNIDRALNAFGAPSVKDDRGEETNEFRALLNDSGLGNNPTMVRIFNNIGKALGEDTQLVRTDAIKTVNKSAEQVLYPDDTPKT